MAIIGDFKVPSPCCMPQCGRSLFPQPVRLLWTDHQTPLFGAVPPSEAKWFDDGYYCRCCKVCEKRLPPDTPLLIITAPTAGTVSSVTELYNLVTHDRALATIAADNGKITVDSPADGILMAVRVAKGGTVKNGDVLGVVDPCAVTHAFYLSEFRNMFTTCTIRQWRKHIGDRVHIGDSLLQVSTDEFDIEIPADVDGILTHILMGEGQVVQNDPPLAVICCREVSRSRLVDPEDVVMSVRVPDTVPPKAPPEDHEEEGAEREPVTLGVDLDSGAPVRVTTQHLCSGCYILGVQGVGKSSLLEQIACQLFDRDESVIVFDPHGQLIDNIVARMPASRLKDTYYLNLKDRQYPFGLNVFACANPDDEVERDRTRNQVTHAFEKLWPETGTGVYFKKLLRHLIILLIEQAHLTLADVPRLLGDEAFRTRYTEQLQNTGSRNFWQYDYGKLNPASQRTEAKPLLNRIDELLTEPVITRILCQARSTINLRALIGQRKNLLIRLPINEDAYAKAAGLVGTMLMAMVYAVTFSFADMLEGQQPGFSLIVDEFQNFATDEYARLFAQGRKYGVKQFLAHQYRDQLAEAAMEANKAATLTAQTKIIFAVTKADAQVLAEDFVPFEQRRRPVNLDVAPLSAMDRHPHPAVKEFANQYGRPLAEGAHDRVQSAPASDWRKWEWLGRPDDYRRPSPLLPIRDFGGGPLCFYPHVAAEVFKLLNDLLYQTQKTGRIDRDREAHVVVQMTPLFGSEQYAKTIEARKLFARRLHHVLEVLLVEPVTVGRSAMTSKGVALTLQHLPRRQAYVRIGTAAYVMQTRELEERVSADEERRRFGQLQEQTRRALCRHVSELGGGPDEPGAAGGLPKVDPRPPQPPQPATETAPGSPSPRIRRSRPLP